MRHVCIYILLHWWGGHCCPMHCDLFKIYCAPPNLGITRTLICRLNFAQRPIFLGLRFFIEPEISDSGPHLEVPPGGLVLRIFTSWKNPSTSVGFEPAKLGSQGEHVTPRQPRPTKKWQGTWKEKFRGMNSELLEWRMHVVSLYDSVSDTIHYRPAGSQELCCLPVNQVCLCWAQRCFMSPAPSGQPWEWSPDPSRDWTSLVLTRLCSFISYHAQQT